MSAPHYIQLINMGGDHCGMGLATDYPDGHEDAATRSRADDSEWIKASDHDDVVRELIRAGSNMHVFVDLYGDEAMRSAAAEWRAALAKIAQHDS